MPPPPMPMMPPPPMPPQLPEFLELDGNLALGTFDTESSIRELVTSLHAVVEAFKQFSETIPTNIRMNCVYFSGVDAALSRMDDAAKAIVPSRFFNEHSLYPSTALDRLLNTTELVAEIFSYFDLPNLLVLRQVNHRFRDVIGTQKLQKALFMIPDMSSRFRIPMENFDSFRSDKNLEKVNEYPRLKILQTSSPWSTFAAPTPGVRIELSCDAGLERFVISSLYRQMLVCQPPIKRFTVDHVGCCRDRRQTLRAYHNNVAKPVVEVETGVIIGDVYDAAKAIVKEHHLCPLAPIDILDDEGVVQPDVGFVGFVDTDGIQSIQDQNLWAFGPTTAGVLGASPRRAERSAKDKSHLQAYSTAKLLAAHNEIAIPTLAEYDAQRVYYDGLPQPYWLEQGLPRPRWLDGIDGPH